MSSLLAADREFAFCRVARRACEFEYARLTVAHGLGPGPLPEFKAVSAKQLGAALLAAVNEPRYKAAAAALRDQMHRERGTKLAVEALEEMSHRNIWKEDAERQQRGVTHALTPPAIVGGPFSARGLLRPFFGARPPLSAPGLCRPRALHRCQSAVRENVVKLDPRRRKRPSAPRSWLPLLPARLCALLREPREVRVRPCVLAPFSWMRTSVDTRVGPHRRP